MPETPISTVEGWIVRNDGYWGQRRFYCPHCRRHSGLHGPRPFCPWCGGPVGDEKDSAGTYYHPEKGRNEHEQNSQHRPV